MFVIALNGWKQSGKDTTAEFLEDAYGFTRYAFADTLKDLVANTYKIPRASLDDPKLKEKALPQYPVNPKDPFGKMITDYMKAEFSVVKNKKYWNPRSLAILEGSVKRSVNTQHWVNTITRSITTSTTTKAVITDLRYRSEVEELRKVFDKQQLLIVRINRWDESPSVDPSERDLDDFNFDIVIENREGIEELHRQIQMSLSGVVPK